MSFTRGRPFRWRPFLLFQRGAYNCAPIWALWLPPVDFVANASSASTGKRLRQFAS